MVWNENTQDLTCRREFAFIASPQNYEPVLYLNVGGSWCGKTNGHWRRKRATSLQRKFKRDTALTLPNVAHVKQFIAETLIQISKRPEPWEQTLCWKRFWEDTESKRFLAVPYSYGMFERLMETRAKNLSPLAKMWSSLLLILWIT